MREEIDPKIKFSKGMVLCGPVIKGLLNWDGGVLVSTQIENWCLEHYEWELYLKAVIEAMHFT